MPLLFCAGYSLAPSMSLLCSSDLLPIMNGVTKQIILKNDHRLLQVYPKYAFIDLESSGPSHSHISDVLYMQPAEVIAPPLLFVVHCNMS